jgi:hypothetical protein
MPNITAYLQYGVTCQKTVMPRSNLMQFIQEIAAQLDVLINK